MICSPQNNTGAPMKKRNFSAEFIYGVTLSLTCTRTSIPAS
ncbi:IS911 transposase [Shigella dysenteriae 1617]|nr:transposase InsN for insertion sequence element [Escherichia coli 53638]EFP73884.1 IS911 transposase [Shigella dysenteriae 1617]